MVLQLEKQVLVDAASDEHNSAPEEVDTESCQSEEEATSPEECIRKEGVSEEVVSKKAQQVLELQRVQQLIRMSGVLEPKTKANKRKQHRKPRSAPKKKAKPEPTSLVSQSSILQFFASPSKPQKATEDTGSDSEDNSPEEPSAQFKLTLAQIGIREHRHQFSISDKLKAVRCLPLVIFELIVY